MTSFTIGLFTQVSDSGPHGPLVSVVRWSFPFQNNRINLDLSYKTDLDIWDCFGRVNS